MPRGCGQEVSPGLHLGCRPGRALIYRRGRATVRMAATLATLNQTVGWSWHCGSPCTLWHFPPAAGQTARAVLTHLYFTNSAGYLYTSVRYMVSTLAFWGAQEFPLWDGRREDVHRWGGVAHNGLGIRATLSTWATLCCCLREKLTSRRRAQRRTASTNACLAFTCCCMPWPCSAKRTVKQCMMQQFADCTSPRTT